MIKPGDIGLSNKRKGWYPAAVRFFTRSKFSHVFIVGHEFYNELTVIEADLKVQVVPFKKEYIEKNADAYKIYRPKLASQKEIYKALAKTYQSAAGETYGFMQIPWFAVRSILGKFGIKLSHNWFPIGQICSETPVGYLKDLGQPYAVASINLTPNETSPEDIAKIILAREDLFEFITERV